MAQTHIQESDNTVLERKVKKPKKYAVVFHNNDYTPFEFVFSVIIAIFNKSPTEAEAITVAIHKSQKAVVAVYPYEIAEDKKNQCLKLCKAHQQPLKITLEQV